jgi:hypothetical protein
MHKAMHRRPLDTHCTALLAGAGAGAALAHLDLSGNTLGDAGAAALAAALHDNTALTLLGLHANGVGDEGAAALATALPVAVLRYVGLNMNRVGDRGATALAGAVAGLPLTSGRGTTAGYKGRPPSVTAVPQHPCPPQASGKALGASTRPGGQAPGPLRSMSSRRHACEPLREIICSGRAGVVTVKLDNNDVGDAGARALAAALARSHALGALWLRGNARIGAAGASALAAAARANPSTEVAADPAPPGSGGGSGGGGGGGGGGNGGVLPLDFAGAERLRAGLTAHAFVMFGRELCEACAALGEQWSQLAAVPLLVGQLVEMAPTLGEASAGWGGVGWVGVGWGGGGGGSRLPLRAQACPLAPERPDASGGAAALPPVSERSLKRGGARFFIHHQAGRLWHISCDEQPELCRQVGDVPAFEAWPPGGGAERYAGQKSTEGLVEFLRLKVELEQQALPRQREDI